MAALHREGGRATRQRRMILEVIDAAPKGISAEELTSSLARTGVRAARSTIYRTLDTLRRIGAVELVHRRPEHHRYLARRSAHQHHVVCEACGAVGVFEGCQVERALDAIGAKTGFAVERHTLELFGRCPDCEPARRA
ncbi:MAG: transcriptional repressor [Actinobacteria bacterium]|nr:transcriptional repressor [Actinomycetota bacterium]